MAGRSCVVKVERGQTRNEKLVKLKGRPFYFGISKNSQRYPTRRVTVKKSEKALLSIPSNIQQKIEEESLN
jgi:hypothetical protein